MGAAADAVHIATKVRLDMKCDLSIGDQVRQSFACSLARLGVQQVTCLQLHNSVTQHRDDLPTSITPHDVLGPGGALEAFRQLRDAGQVRYFGLTGLGDRQSLAEVIDSGEFQTIQICYHVLNPSAGRAMPADFADEDFGHLIELCRQKNLAVLAIRVLAGGALADQPPSAHTLTTRFFPLSLYERDRQRARQVAERLPAGLTLKQAALRFVWSDPRVATAIIGLASPEQVDEALAACEAGPLPDEVLKRL